MEKANLCIRKKFVMPDIIRMGKNREKVYSVIEPTMDFDKVIDYFNKNGYELIYFDTILLKSEQYNHGIFTCDKKNFYKNWNYHIGKIFEKEKGRSRQ